MPITRPLRIGTRGSVLARRQTLAVARRIGALPGAPETELVEISTRGDRLVDQALTPSLGRGFFTGEIEQALLDGHIDLAVHSLKDLASEDPAGLILAAIPEREDPRDALVFADSARAADSREAARSGLKSAGELVLEGLARGARIGTSSPRRKAFLLRARSDLRPLDVRGNVPTRLRKLDEGGYDALLLAAAGLHRLGLADRIGGLLPAARFPPAPGQGALAVQTRVDDEETRRWVEPLDALQWRLEVTAERSLLSTLGAGCQTPVGAIARLHGDRLALRAAVSTVDGRTVIEDRFEAEVVGLRGASELGRSLGNSLLERGAREILRRIRGAAD